MAIIPSGFFLISLIWFIRYLLIKIYPGNRPGKLWNFRFEKCLKTDDHFALAQKTALPILVKQGLLSLLLGVFSWSSTDAMHFGGILDVLVVVITVFLFRTSLHRQINKQLQ